MSCSLTAKQQEQIRQASATMAIENMPVTDVMYQDAIDYLSGQKSEQEVLDSITNRSRNLKTTHV